LVTGRKRPLVLHRVVAKQTFAGKKPTFDATTAGCSYSM